MSTAYVVPIDPESLQSVEGKTNIDAKTLWTSLPPFTKTPKAGTTRVFYNTPSKDNLTVLSSLGGGFDALKGNAKRETIRKAVGNAVKALREMDGVKEVYVDGKLDPHAVASAAHLARWKFTLKTDPTSVFDPRLKEALPQKFDIYPLEKSKEWTRGVVGSEAQNFARTLMEHPANMITPTVFTERVKAEFQGVENVEIIVRDEKWAEEKGMKTFLSVTHGTNEPAKFLEIHYKGAPSKDDKPLGLVGKGITFDSGGISLKPRAGMKLMRGDMGGAATVVSSALAIAKMKLPINLIVATPLTENLPGPSATKPGDIVYAMNGKSVEVDNTDAEGRLVLADALYYVASTYKPHSIIDAATLTGAMVTAIGEVYTGVFTSNDEIWSKLNAAGEHEYDRMWRMPLDEDYGPQIYSSNADLCNTGGPDAGCCTAALFLKAFLTDELRDKWAHLDLSAAIAERSTAYLEKGMTGRPVLALVEYMRRLAAEKTN